jgi:hypothetical protein
MNKLIAKPILKNKFWIVESEGSQIATIQAIEQGGFVYVQNGSRKKFSTITVLSKTYNLKFSRKNAKTTKEKSVKNSIYGFPLHGRAYQIMWDLKHKLPVFAKLKNSKSFYCAGYYIIKLNQEWTESFCPKLITLNRYEFLGPFKTKEEMNDQFRLLNNG